MSKADKMFEELGFVKIEGYGISYINDGHEISFSLEDRAYVSSVNRTPMCELITIKEHLAINAKMKELGWI